MSSAGDINGDGFDDMIIGAPLAGDDFEGESYVIFGRDFSNGFNSITVGEGILMVTIADNLVGSEAMILLMEPVEQMP